MTDVQQAKAEVGLNDPSEYHDSELSPQPFIDEYGQHESWKEVNSNPKADTNNDIEEQKSYITLDNCYPKQSCRASSTLGGHKKVTISEDNWVKGTSLQNDWVADNPGSLKPVTSFWVSCHQLGYVPVHPHMGQA
ncbi:hypothetical protein NDU88_007813 [Pleurodeles waltl]|uniref:Uncharacterized protein n=1 Tax=Pleurodeles waltl TaxID=8319 RepID=A0AAV7N7E6_PLEWA|nr:hypothetical protein NDU88_007813 [Pleurodeles waltl]